MKQNIWNENLIVSLNHFFFSAYKPDKPLEEEQGGKNAPVWRRTEWRGKVPENETTRPYWGAQPLVWGNSGTGLESRTAGKQTKYGFPKCPEY